MSRTIGITLASLVLLMSIPLAVSASQQERPWTRFLQDFPREEIETGILYDLAVPLSKIGDYDGGRESRPASLPQWRQLYHEIYRASLAEPAWPPLEEVIRTGRIHAERGVVPLAAMDFRFDRIRPDALESGDLAIQNGRLALGEGEPFYQGRVFAVTPLGDATYRGDRVIFRLPHDLYLTNGGVIASGVVADFDDGRGFVSFSFDRDHPVRYLSPGRKTLRFRFEFGDGTILHASSVFDVERLQTPTPDDTLQVTATIPYLGQFGTGEAYVYLSDANDTLTDPIVVVEGFDLDNSMNWDELYALLNREGLLENLRSMGFDAVVLNFSDATDYVQRNAFVLVELIEQVNALIGPETDVAVVGASMGGIVSRYALAYMETNGLSPNARTFISFDSPQTGANIPLGIQYWLAFFADLSDDAAGLLAALDSPAARQLLAYHHTDPPGSTGESDPLRAELLTDLEAVGQYPSQLRKVAVANGSSTQMDQGFSAGDQIIQWEYSDLLVDIIGNVWAVPEGSSQAIFHGLVDFIIFPPDELYVTVGGTLPFDNAPGGFRDSMAEMGDVEAPYGDIIALHDNHCFIPTVSALALDTQNLFYDVAGDPDILSLTPFDAVYFPVENQEHVAITPENAQWLIAEIQRGAALVPDTGLEPLGKTLLSLPFPNPFASSTSVRFLLPEDQNVRISVVDASGRLVTRVAEDHFAAGEHSVSWDGAGPGGIRLGSGVYFLRLTADGLTASRKVLLR